MNESSSFDGRKICEGPLYSVTYSTCKRSPGTKHDYYSEGTYWWPNEENPDGPYINKDGQVYPGAFFDHADSVLAVSWAVGTLARACLIQRQARWLGKISELLETFFINPKTRMAPHLKFAQAIPGQCAGRCYGIIDTHHFAEIVLAVEALEAQLPADIVAALREWFAQFNKWLLTSDPGIEERNTTNNHSIYYLVQVAAYARFTRNYQMLEQLRKHYMEITIPDQAAPDGRMDAEIKRTKSFAYSCFAANGLAILCKLLSTETENLFSFATKDGKSISRVMEFLYPYLDGSTDWPHTDIFGFTPEDLKPVSLLFIGSALGVKKYLSLYEALRGPLSGGFELRRDFCVKQPSLWMNSSVPWTV